VAVQHETFQVTAHKADDFVRAWVEYGYNSLGEEGVVRCDLLRQVDDPTSFLARRVFRSHDVRRQHQAGEHYTRWVEQVGPMMEAAELAPLLHLDAVYPETSLVPFRSRWTTV